MESTRLRADIEDMKNTLRTSENRLLKVTQRATHLDAEIIEARQMREGADRDLLQALTTTEKLAGLTEENKDLWNAVRPLAERCCLPEDVGKEWPDILPLLPKRFDFFVNDAIKECVQSLLAQLRVTEKSVNIEKLAEAIPPGPIADAISVELDGVEEIARRIMAQMTLSGGPDSNVPVLPYQLEQAQESHPAQEETGTEAGSPAKDATLPEDTERNPEDALAASQDPPAAYIA